MPANHQKLELSWIGKENRPRLEPRILLEDPDLSYHAAQRLTEIDIFDNRLVFCSAFRGKPDAYPNLTLTRIPNAILSKCEFGKDDYSLAVENLPMRPPEPGPVQPSLDLD